MHHYDPVQEEINEDIRRELDFEEEFGCSPAEHSRLEAERNHREWEHVNSMDDADYGAMEHAFSKDD